jgi:hypothetical protein
MPDEKYLIPDPPKLEPRESRPHPIRVRLDVIALIVAGIGGLFSFLQWTAAQKQADIAEHALGEARRAADEQAKDVQRARKAAERSADAAEVSVRDSESRFRDEHRPWIGPTFSISALSPAGTIAVAYRNIGKTPAFDVVVAMSVDTTVGFPRTFPAMFAQYYKVGKKTSSDVLFPNVEMMLDSNLRSLTERHIDAITRAQGTLFIHGQIDYKDSLKRPHQTLFCEFYLPSERVLTPCPYHNSAD